MQYCRYFLLRIKIINYVYFYFGNDRNNIEVQKSHISTHKANDLNHINERRKQKDFTIETH